MNLVLLQLCLVIGSLISPSWSLKPTIARTSCAVPVDLHFDADGRCRTKFFAQNKPFTLHHVPGDGDCMFLAVTLGQMWQEEGRLLDWRDTKSIETLAGRTRKQVSKVLQSKSAVLAIDSNQRRVSAAALLAQASQGDSGYIPALETMGKDGGMYGGGPELVVMSNILQKRINIYEMDGPPVDDRCELSCEGIFGEGVFVEELHVLILDMTSREKHACLLIPD